MWPPKGPHAIARTTSLRIPNRFVILDTEARRTPDGRGGEIQTWALGVARFIDRKPRGKRDLRVEDADFESPAELWAWVDRHTSHERRTVLVAHNLAYDLRIADAARELVALGWEHGRTRFHGSSSWSKWRKGKRSLVMVDLWSWLPTRLDDIGRMVGLRQLELPPDGATDDDLRARCRRDVEITALAWSTILEWIERNELGSWAMTGSGQAWAAFRHGFMAHRITAHMDLELHAVEREASWTARTEVWRHGKAPAGRYSEWDFSMSYARVAASEHLPVRFLRSAPEKAGATHLDASPAVGWLARVRVTTTEPLVPARRDGHICWPVGTFTTTLWSPELELLERAGQSYVVEEAWLYRRAPALRDFCRFLIATALDDGNGVPDLVRAVCHQWGRSIVGRTAMRYTVLVPFYAAPEPDFTSWLVVDAETGVQRRAVQVGTDVQIEEADFSPPDACPMIMSWVMSAARVRLWETMQAAGLDHVLYVDTDCALVDPAGDRRLAKAVRSGQLEGLRRKGVWGDVELRAPRQIVLDDDLRASGVPKSAERISPNRWEARIWRGFLQSWRRSEPDRVAIEVHRINLRARDRRRRHLPHGETRPWTLREPLQRPQESR